MGFLDGLRWLGEKVEEGLVDVKGALNIANQMEGNHGVYFAPDGERVVYAPGVSFSDPTVQSQYEITHSYLEPSPVMNVSGAVWNNSELLRPQERIQHQLRRDFSGGRMNQYFFGGEPLSGAQIPPVGEYAEGNHGIYIQPEGVERVFSPEVAYSDPTLKSQYERTNTYLEAPPVMDVFGASYGKQSLMNPRENLQSRGRTKVEAALKDYSTDYSFSVGPQKLSPENWQKAIDNVYEEERRKTGLELSRDQIVRLLNGKNITLDMLPYLQGEDDNDFPAQGETGSYLDDKVELRKILPLPEISLLEEDVFRGIMSEAEKDAERRRRQTAKKIGATRAFGHGFMNSSGGTLEAIGDLELEGSEFDRGNAQTVRKFEDVGYSSALIDPYDLYKDQIYMGETGLVGKDAMKATRKEDVAPHLQDAWKRKKLGKEIQDRYRLDLRYADGEMREKFAYDLGGYAPEILTELLLTKGLGGATKVVGKLDHWLKARKGIQASKTMSAAEKVKWGTHVNHQIAGVQEEIRNLIEGNSPRLAPVGAFNGAKGSFYRKGIDIDDGRRFFSQSDEGIKKSGSLFTGKVELNRKSWL